MAANQDPAINQGVLFEQSIDQATLDPGHVVHKVHEIAQQRLASTASRLESLESDPRIQTLLETGQLTVASALISESMTGMQDPPRFRTGRKPRASRRGGRSYSEGTENELDPHWNAPAAERTVMEADNSRAKAREVIETLKSKHALDTYLQEIPDRGVSSALARLRTKGYLPDPRTGGRTIITIAEANKLRES